MKLAHINLCKLSVSKANMRYAKRPPDADYIILADPEGNRFCVIDTTM